MSQYKKYPREIWEYIKDLPYMPSRVDREKLFWDGKKRERVQLWDYFFRIRPEDIGKPQRKEFLNIKKKIQEDAKRCREREKEILIEITDLKKEALKKAIIKFFTGTLAISILISLLNRTSFAKSLSSQNRFIYGGIALLTSLIILIVLTGVGYVYGNEIRRSKELLYRLENLKKTHVENANEAKNRVMTLKKEIARLRRQTPYAIKRKDIHKLFPNQEVRIWVSTEIRNVKSLPDKEFRTHFESEVREIVDQEFRTLLDNSLNEIRELPDNEFRAQLEKETKEIRELSGQEVRSWLGRRIRTIKEEAREEVAINRNLVPLKNEKGEKADNPIVVVGPGELQAPIPRPFTPDISEDLHKHLSARQAHVISTKDGFQKDFEVLYGVYFIQFIFIAENMLITYSFFYDFIDDMIRTRHITEQYYKDVVGLQIINEYRKLATSEYKANPIYIEDAPTFTLSLSSGERHRVTFVNKDYFMKIRDKVKLSEEDVEQITWVPQSTENAKNAIAALRGRLRKHKVR